MKRLLALLALLLVPLAAGGGGEPRPLIGTSYTHWGLLGCDFGGTGILHTYPASGVVRRQLAAMRAAGIETLRLLLWHMHDAGEHTWGVVSSQGGRIAGDGRLNLIRYLQAVRASGFERLTIAFDPQWTNSPFDTSERKHDPSLVDENWSFIRDVRGLAKQYGPPQTRFDLLAYGPPTGDDLARSQFWAYVTRMYGRYALAFGNDDVTVSAAVGDEADPTGLVGLVAALRASGHPLPRWFELHMPHAAGEALDSLRLADRTLDSEGLAQPLTAGDLGYSNGPLADALRTFTATSSRPLEEIIQVPLRVGSSCDGMSVQPPYEAEAYVTALTGSRPRSNVAVAFAGPGRWVLRSPYGHPVSGLLAGPYTFRVRDTSLGDNFHLRGPGVNRRTPVGGKANVTWRVSLRQGVYRYWSDSRGPGSARTFVVMTAG